jgi:hypothetical protein
MMALSTRSRSRRSCFKRALAIVKDPPKYFAGELQGSCPFVVMNRSPRAQLV